MTHIFRLNRSTVCGRGHGRAFRSTGCLAQTACYCMDENMINFPLLNDDHDLMMMKNMILTHSSYVTVHTYPSTHTSTVPNHTRSSKSIRSTHTHTYIHTYINCPDSLVDRVKAVGSRVVSCGVTEGIKGGGAGGVDNSTPESRQFRISVLMA